MRKDTAWVTDCGHLAESIREESQRRLGVTWHRRVDEVDGRLVETGRKPWAIQVAILSATLRTAEEKGEVCSFGQASGAEPVPEEGIEIDEDPGFYLDDVTGAELKPEKVKEARETELDWIRKQKVYVKVPIQQCWDRTGKGPITLKWVDTNKGDDINEKYRSRLVVREIKKNGKRALPDHELFSSMPPLRVTEDVVLHADHGEG